MDGRELFLRLVHPAPPAPPAGTVAVEPGALDAAAAMAVEHNLFMLLYGRVRSLGERVLPAGEADDFLERHRRLYYTGVARIDRTTVSELTEIPTLYENIQMQMDEADRGLNPLGLAKGVVPFDIDPARVDAGETHFEQVFARAEQALGNLVSAWDYANVVSRMLRFNQDTVEDLTDTVREDEFDFMSRLMEIYGTPYPEDDIYPETYFGPDLYHWQYIDLVSLAGVQLDGVGTQSGGRVDLPVHRIEKQADHDAGLLQSGDHFADALAITGHVEPALGGYFLAALGHERGLIGLGVAGDPHNLLLAGHFQVQLHGDRLAEQFQISIDDMTPILAQV